MTIRNKVNDAVFVTRGRMAVPTWLIIIIIIIIYYIDICVYLNGADLLSPWPEAIKLELQVKLYRALQMNLQPGHCVSL